jgi:acetoacetate decarboxylase
MPVDLPFYVERPAPIAAQPPGVIGDAWVYAFGFAANVDAISKMCAAYLNPAARGGLSYQPALPMAALTFLSAGRMTSGQPYGWMDERECAVWVPLLAVEAENGRSVAKRLVWWMPYVFVDTDAAMATGREVWGYPKSIGSFTLPVSPDAPNPEWSISTRLFPTLGPDTEGVVAPLITVTSLPDPTTSAASVWHTVADAGRDMLAIVRQAFAMPARPSLEFAADVLDTLIHREMPVVNLKQFRDCADPTRACYQAIVEAPCTVQTFYGGGLLAGHHHVSITQAASHPIISDLGLAGTEVDALYGAWCHMDFLAMTGQEVSRSQTGPLTA